jgi:hypothetical protein
MIRCQRVNRWVRETPPSNMLPAQCRSRDTAAPIRESRARSNASEAGSTGPIDTIDQDGRPRMSVRTAGPRDPSARSNELFVDRASRCTRPTKPLENHAGREDATTHPLSRSRISCARATTRVSAFTWSASRRNDRIEDVVRNRSLGGRDGRTVRPLRSPGRTRPGPDAP